MKRKEWYLEGMFQVRLFVNFDGSPTVEDDVPIPTIIAQQMLY